MSKSKAKSVASETITNEPVETSTKITKSRQKDTFDEDISNIESWNVKALNNFLARNIQLDDDELDILMEQKIDGEYFFKLTKEELKKIGIKGGPAGRIVALAERLKPKTCEFTLNYEEMNKTYTIKYHSLSDLTLKRFQQLVQKAFNLSDTINYKIIIKYNDTVLDCDESVQFVFKGKEEITLIIMLDKKEFYSYKNLKEVLQINGIDGDELQDMPLFNPGRVDLSKEENDEMDAIDVCVEGIKAILSAIGDVQCDQNEVQRSFIITTILVAAVNFVENAFLRAKIIGNFLNYTIKRNYPLVTEEIICITVAKQNDIKEGIAQNIMQIRSTYETSGKKRKLNELTKGYTKYVYGIVTNATEWYFLKYTPEKLCCSNVPSIIPLAQATNDKNLRNSVQTVIEKIVWMMDDRDRFQSNKKTKTTQ